MNALKLVSQTWTRREVADRLGVTYATLRVYERHLDGMIVLSQGPNRTTLYNEEAFDLMERAIELKRSGLPFAKLEEYFRGELAPKAASHPSSSKLQEIHSRTEEILSIGHRIEEKLRAVEALFANNSAPFFAVGKGADCA